MYLLHYILPVIVFYFYRNKIMLWGLMFANLIDLDHIYYRLIGKVGLFESACSRLGENCSFGFYPLHNFDYTPIFLMLINILVIGGLIFVNKKEVKSIRWINIRTFLELIGWLSIGLFVHLVLDYLHLLIGFGI